MSEDTTVINIKRLLRAETAAKVIVQPARGIATEAEIQPGEELVVRLEPGETLTIRDA